MKSNLEFSIKALALKYRGVTKESLEKSLKWAKRHYKRYKEYLLKVNHYRIYERNDRYILKELLFQGFIPIEKFHKKAECNYIQTNRKIQGHIYIYPVHAGHDISIIRQGYIPIYELMDTVGLPGYTKVDVVSELNDKPLENGNKKNRKKRKSMG